MKSLLPPVVCLLLCLPPHLLTAAEPEFDSELAQRLGADDYGMRRYVMAFLQPGPEKAIDPARARELQAGHMALIQILAGSGKLLLAGPFLDGGDLRGIYVFAVDSVEEAQALTANDPAVAAGALRVEFRPWYGSAALPELNAIHARIARTQP